MNCLYFLNEYLFIGCLIVYNVDLVRGASGAQWKRNTEVLLRENQITDKEGSEFETLSIKMDKNLAQTDDKEQKTSQTNETYDSRIFEAESHKAKVLSRPSLRKYEASYETALESFIQDSLIDSIEKSESDSDRMNHEISRRKDTGLIFNVSNDSFNDFFVEEYRSSDDWLTVDELVKGYDTDSYIESLNDFLVNTNQNPPFKNKQMNRRIESRSIPDAEEVNWKTLKRFKRDYSTRNNFNDGRSSDEVADRNHYSSEENNETEWCRTRDGRFLPPKIFAWDTCAHCYLFELRKKPLNKVPWNLTKEIVDFEGHLFLILTLVNNSKPNETEKADLSQMAIFEASQDLKLRDNWRSCCSAAIRCCTHMRATPQNMVIEYCPRTWDGWQCWGDASPNSKIEEPCPSHSYIETTPTCTKSASKECLSNGTWFRRKGVEWSDYSSCGQLNNIRLRLQCHVGALALSVIALTPALVILSLYRQLHVHRITLHRQLFVSLLFESCCSISFRLLQLYAVHLIQENSPWCISLFLVRIYARQTNYMWYFCEGFYLHKLLASAFAEQRSLLVFYVMGWGFPVIPVTLYFILRGTLMDNSHCWNIPSEKFEWIIQLPPLLAILINLIFIINIMRILVSKVRATNDSEPSQFRMAVRATLIVVPLFGLQYIITIYRPKGGACDWIDAYHIINNIIDGSTGFVVAIIFCYSNSEVQTLLRRSWSHFKDRHGYEIPERLQRSFRLKSLSTIQTTLVEVNAQSMARRASSNPSIVVSKVNSKCPANHHCGQKKGSDYSIREKHKSNSFEIESNLENYLDGDGRGECDSRYLDDHSLSSNSKNRSLNSIAEIEREDDKHNSTSELLDKNDV